MTRRKRLASLLRTVADRLAPPEPPPPPPDPGGIDLTQEDGDHRSKAALGLVDGNVVGWLLITLRDQGDATGAISIHGFVPKYAYAAYAETLRRVESTLVE